MKGAFGALQWTPETFWRSTLTEYTLAIDGFSEAKGGTKSKAPSNADLDALMAKYG